MKTAKQKRRISIFIAIIILMVLIFGVYYQLSRNKDDKEHELSEEQKAVPCTADGIVVKMMPVNQEYSCRGTVQANKIVTICATADGNVVFSTITKGVKVHHGELLLKVDSIILSAANRRNEDSYRKAEHDYLKLRDLFRSGNAMENEVSNALLQMQSAAAQLNISGKQLKQTAVFAPVSGVIVDKKINRGEYVSTGTPLAAIACLDTVLVNMYVGKRLRGTLRRDFFSSRFIGLFFSPAIGQQLPVNFIGHIGVDISQPV